MIREYYERVCAGDQLRQNLISLRDELKDKKNCREFAYLLAGDFSKLCALLENEDPKVRRNAALILGKMESEDLLPVLFDAYKNEKTLFIRADYLKAMRQMDYRPLLRGLKERLEQLRETETPPEERKHIQEELHVLQEMVSRFEQHRFTGWHEPLQLVLVTNRYLREVTARQISVGKLKMLAGGIRVSGAQVAELCKLRTYHEMLFPLSIGKILWDHSPESEEAIKAAESTKTEESANAEEPAKAEESEKAAKPAKISAQQAAQIGAALAKPVLKLAQRLHEGDGAYLFRIELRSRMELHDRGVLVRGISNAVEQVSDGMLINSVSSYELEIRLLERRDGSFLPMVKFFTIPDMRFAYRRESVASSITPVNAALAVELARPYLKEGAQVLDPFCGVGTMLIERDRAVKAGIMYGVDIFGEAIEKARRNTERAGCKVYYINKDFFAFEHSYRFDEIITDLPQVTENHSLQEIRGLYQDFFAVAGRCLQPEAMLIIYTMEPKLVREAVRGRGEYQIIERHTVNEKTGTEVLIIKRNANA